MNGGVFLRTDEAYTLREMVQVRLDLDWIGKALQLPGEVVHIVPAEMAGMGGTPGVAVQFSDSAGAVRQKLRELGVTVGEPDKSADKGVRSAPRTPVRVGARVAGTSQVVDGRIVRQVASDGEVSALAVHFTPRADERDAFERFATDLQQVEHTLRLGGISGPIAELGPQNVVQMFATSAPEGTLWLRCGEEEGMVCFQRGLLRLARVGNHTGVKALVHMFAWRDGSFEFHARLEDVEMKGAPLPLEAAMLDALRQMDEGTQVEVERFPLHAHVTLVEGADPDGYESPSKVEAAILDLARAGFTVQRMLDVIPEPDPEIFRALQNLRDAGLVELST